MKLPGIKRILPLILTILLLPSLLAVPARADEIADSGWINLTDYFSGSMSFNNSENFVRFTLPYMSAIYDVEVLFYANGTVDSVYLTTWMSSNPGSIVNLGDNYYLARFNLNGFAVDFFSFDVVVGTANYGNVLSVKYRTFGSSIYRVLDATAYGVFATANNFTLQYSGEYVNTFWDASGVGYDSRSFQINTVVAGNVHAFDYLDIILALNVSDIESISVDDTANPLPFEINNIYDSGSDTDGLARPVTYVNLRIDVRGLESGFYPRILISGVSAPASNMFAISSVCGVLIVDPPSPLSYWFSEVNLWISNQTSSLLSGLSGIVNSINSGISSIGNWLTQQINAVQTWGSNIVTSVNTWGQNIVDAIVGTGDPSDIQSGIDSAVGELNQAGAALDAVQRPDIGKVDINIVGGLDPAGLSGFASIVSLFTGNSVIYTIMMMFVTLSLISYILFGKG